MIRIALRLSLLILILAAPAAAEEFKLSPMKIKVTEKNARAFPWIEIRPRTLSDLEREPKYRSRNPKKFVRHFGGNDGITVSFAVDEKAGDGEGYNYLHVDLTGQGDLVKGKKLNGKNVLVGRDHCSAIFPTCDIQIPSPGGAAAFPLQTKFVWHVRNLEDAVLRLTACCALKGKVTFGSKEQTVIVFDADCNGVFGDPGAPFNTPLRGDKIWVGRKPPKMEQAYADAIPFGRYFQFEGDCFEFSLSGGLAEPKISVEPATGPLGMIELGTAGFVLELMQGNQVFRIDCGEATTIQIPAGTYSVHTAWIEGEMKGAPYVLEGKPGSFKNQIKVEPENTTRVELGPPLKIKITTSQTIAGTGTQINMVSIIEGIGGEIYRRLYKHGRRFDHPLIVVRNPQDKPVHKGVFGYDDKGDCVYKWRIQSTIHDGDFSFDVKLDTGPFAQDEEYINTFEIRR